MQKSTLFSKIIGTIWAHIVFMFVAGVMGIIFPWVDISKHDKFYIRSIPGRILGSIICCIGFAVGGIVFGFYYPWSK